MPPALRSSLLLGLLALSARGEVVADSPEAMAAAVRTLVSSGAGALMPDLDRAYVEDGGLVPLGEGDFPAMFLHGLVAEWRDGVAVFPVEVRLDDATGDAYFLDAAGEPFWYVPSNVPERYRPWLVANPWFAPSRAGIRWTFVHDADAALLRAASAPAGRRAAPLRSLPPPPITNLCFTGFTYTGTSVWFSAAWPASALPLPGDTLDVYAKTNLLDAHWFPLAELPVAPAATNATLEIPGDDIPGFFVPPHVHDETCPAVTNITFDLVSNEPVTGIVYRCYRYQAVSSGFLRLGTRLDTDGDGLTDSAEMLVHGTRPDRLDTDGDGVPDGISPMDWFSNPLWATNGMDADFLVDIVAPTDGSAETVLTLDGWRIPLSPRAGPWAFSLPPGEIVSCSVASTGPFFVLWAGTSGGSFWNLPESFEKPVWTYGMLSVSGNHETAGSCQIAVPVLTVEPVLDEAPTAGTVPGCSHVSPDGSVCVHGEDGVQRFSLSASPSVLAIGRTPVATGSAQIDSTGPFIDVTGTTGVQEGTVGFGPGTESGSDGVLWGMLEKGVAAHRCDATPDNPYCSVCGCHRSEACDAAVFGDCATRVGSSARIRLQADRPRDWSLSGPSGFQMRLFANETGGTGSISVDHTSSVWVGGGGRPEKCIVTAKCPGEQCSGTELPVWTLQVTLETVTGSRDDRSFVINPAGSVVGETETFRLSVLPESYVSEQGARWQTEEGASVLDDGTEARIRFGWRQGRLVLHARIRLRRTADAMPRLSRQETSAPPQVLHRRRNGTNFGKSCRIDRCIDRSQPNLAAGRDRVLLGFDNVHGRISAILLGQDRYDRPHELCGRVSRERRNPRLFCAPRFGRERESVHVHLAVGFPRRFRSVLRDLPRSSLQSGGPCPRTRPCLRTVRHLYVLSGRRGRCTGVSPGGPSRRFPGRWNRGGILLSRRNDEKRNGFAAADVRAWSRSGVAGRYSLRDGTRAR